MEAAARADEAPEVAIQKSASSSRWVILFLAWLAIALTFVDRLAWTSISVQAAPSFGLTTAALGVFVTAFYAGYVISNVVGGLSTDRFGPERIMLAALLPLGLCTFLFGLVSTPLLGIALQALMGLSAGANQSACTKLVVTWFGSKERGRAMGLLTSSNSAGVLIANALVPSLSLGFSWRGAYFILGVVTAVFATTAFLILRRYRAANMTRTLSAPRLDPWVVLRDRNLRLLAVAGFCGMWGTWGTAVWASALMVKGYGMSAVQAGFLVATFGAAGMVTKPIVGVIADRVRPARRATLLAGIFAGFGVVLLVFGQLNDPQMFRIAMPVLGIFAFGYTPILLALVAEAAGLQRTGTAVGMTNAFWQLGSVIVPVTIGVIYAATGSLQLSFLALAAGPLLAGAITLAIRLPNADGELE